MYPIRQIKKVLRTITLLVILLNPVILLGQETIENFYIKIEKVYDNEILLKKMRNDFISQYQKTKATDRLALSKLVEMHLYREDTVGNLRRSYEMINLSKENSELRSRAYFHAAIFLENSSLDLSLFYLQQAKEINEENNYAFAKVHSYHAIGRNYYKRRDYKMAKYYFEKVLQIALKNKNFLLASSMYNNIGLVNAKQNKFSEAILYAQNSIKLLNTHAKSNSDIQFLNLVKTNLAEYFFKLKDYEKSKYYWAQALNFYKKYPIFKRDLEGFLSNFYLVSQGSRQEAQNFVDQLKPFLDQEKNKSLNIKILEILQNHAVRSGNLAETEKYTELLNDYYRGYKKSLQQDRSEVVRILNKYMIEALKREREIDKKEERLKLFVLYLVLAILGIAAYYFYRIREIEKKKKLLLEKENLFMQEKTQRLSLNLKLKSQAEKEFYNKVKKMKIPKSKGAEEVIKDLKMSIFNLLEIDKRHDSELVKGFYQDNEFYENLKNKYPQLNEQERALCGYLKLKLSAKEISMLQGIVPASVYVYKTNIKNKLGLEKGESLEEFLNTI